MTKYFTVLYCRHYAGQLSSQICFSVLVHLSWQKILIKDDYKIYDLTLEFDVWNSHF